jgi:hypothetical protein
MAAALKTHARASRGTEQDLPKGASGWGSERERNSPAEKHSDGQIKNEASFFIVYIIILFTVLVHSCWREMWRGCNSSCFKTAVVATLHPSSS